MSLFQFDYYGCNIPQPHAHVLAHLASQSERLGLVGQEESYGRNGYKRKVEFLTPDGLRHLEVAYGGNPGTYVRGSGCLAAPVAEIVRAWSPDHKVSRFDVCLDVSGQGLFSEMKALALGVAAECGIKTSLRTDPLHPEQGETLYLGSRNSPMFGRIYQKGHEQDARGNKGQDLNLVRYELEVKPQTRDKAAFSKISPDEAAGYARWSRQLVKALTEMDVTPIQRAKVLQNDFWTVAQHGLYSYGNSFMRSGFFDLVANHGVLEPSNSSVIEAAIDLVRDYMLARYPNDKPFDPGFEVFEAINHALKENLDGKA